MITAGDDDDIACNSDEEELEFPTCSNEDGHSWYFTHCDENQAHHACRFCGLRTEGI